MRQLVIACAIAGLVCSVALADAPKTPSDSFTDPNKVIRVSPDKPTVSLRIKSNPTTGYVWLLSDYNSNLLTPVSQKYYPPKGDLMGASGYEVWMFRVKPRGFSVPQMTSITLQSVRPWVVTQNAQKLTFSVVVLKNVIKQTD